MALLQTLDTFWQTSPYAAAALVCGIKGSAADFVAQIKERNEQQQQNQQQQQQEKDGAIRKKNKKKFSIFPISANWQRNLSFSLYGSAYQGITQEYIYNHLYPIWFGTGTGFTTVMTKVIFSLLVQTTLLTLPTLYITKAILMEHMSLRDAMRQYISDVRHKKLLQKFYALWGPVLTLTFSVIPKQYRVTFIAIVSFFWLIILSNISSSGGR
jgi:protein Mpv17